MSNPIESVFIVPVAAMAVGAIAIISGIYSQVHSQRVKAEQRMAMVARGMKPEDIVLLLGSTANDDNPAPRVKDPLRSLANARRTGIVLCSSGLGLIIFGFALAWIVATREVIAVAAVGLIPLAIGIGFFIDYQLQKREMARFGLELEPPTGA
jgi:uncharacterized membrane protein HdeD (DUF308 family)